MLAPTGLRLQGHGECLGAVAKPRACASARPACTSATSGASSEHFLSDHEARSRERRASSKPPRAICSSAHSSSTVAEIWRIDGFGAIPDCQARRRTAGRDRSAPTRRVAAAMSAIVRADSRWPAPSALSRITSARSNWQRVCRSALFPQHRGELGQRQGNEGVIHADAAPRARSARLCSRRALAASPPSLASTRARL